MFLTLPFIEQGFTFITNLAALLGQAPKVMNVKRIYRQLFVGEQYFRLLGFKLRQQCERVVAANLLAFKGRKAELHHAFSCLGERTHRMIAAEKNLRGRHKARECCNSPDRPFRQYRNRGA